MRERKRENLYVYVCLEHSFSLAVRNRTTQYRQRKCSKEQFFDISKIHVFFSRASRRSVSESAMFYPNQEIRVNHAQITSRTVEMQKLMDSRRRVRKRDARQLEPKCRLSIPHLASSFLPSLLSRAPSFRTHSAAKFPRFFCFFAPVDSAPSRTSRARTLIVFYR